MSTQTIELEGFEVELASELYCDRGGDHRELVESSMATMRQLKLEPTTPCRLSGLKRKIAALQPAFIPRELAA